MAVKAYVIEFHSFTPAHPDRQRVITLLRQQYARPAHRLTADQAGTQNPVFEPYRQEIADDTPMNDRLHVISCSGRGDADGRLSAAVSQEGSRNALATP